MKGGLLTSDVYEPYAQALLSLGQSNNLVGDFSNDINLILETIGTSDELAQFFENPFIKDDAKKGVIASLFGGKINPFTQNFLQVLIDRRRIVFLAGICKEFQALVRKLNQAVLAEVTSAVELNDGQKQAIRDRVIAMTGARQVDMETSVDSSLIGGVIIKVGSQVIDASLRGQLRRISYRLAGAN
ncbi:ATP synthase F1 subunit delta [Alkalinema sp. FACHB-956]|uniref:ATP synthase F1 subunit delta n=1 Tax=Alkalinema sp. FACHB-956 TaxID=2692768 RepID=UPI001686B40F|nr:ATP synthase F1 subunit delta [Alkalinema sp. FACHB-956]MBD2326533.1 F0F1 ATP synthase subunit delta [Alkalinema sp. FACHB-956]